MIRIRYCDADPREAELAPEHRCVDAPKSAGSRPAILCEARGDGSLHFRFSTSVGGAFVSVLRAKRVGDRTEGDRVFIETATADDCQRPLWRLALVLSSPADDDDLGRYFQIGPTTGGAY